MTQRTEILEYLLTGRPLTSKQAIEQFGCTRLAAVVHYFRGKDIPIESTRVPVTDRYGKQTNVSKYWIPEEYVQKRTHHVQKGANSR